MDNRGAENVDILKNFPNIRDRFFDSQNYPPQNPYESASPANYYPYQPAGYEL